MNLKAIITGDVINSRKENPGLWMPKLKQTLMGYGKQPKYWEIFRGDSFQLMTKPEDAFLAAMNIKARMKCIEGQDMRMGIGIGNVDYMADRITESNGQAFIRSGEIFDRLMKNELMFKTPSKEFDKTFNLIALIFSAFTDAWKPATALMVHTALNFPTLSQKELARKLNRTQSTVSAGLARAGYAQMQELNKLYRERTYELWN